MSRFINQNYASLEAYTPGEQPKDMKYIKLNTNESPYPPSCGVLKAVEENADKLINNMKTTFSDIKQNSSGDGSKTIYFEVSPLQYGLWAGGKGTFMDEIASMLGLTNIFADVNGWGSISEEQVLQRNPDYIITVSMYFGEGPTPTEEILARPGWEKVTAVKNKAILNLQNNELSRPTNRLADGAKMMYEFIYENKQ